MCNRPIGFIDRQNLSYLTKITNLEAHYKIKKKEYAKYRENICKSLSDDFDAQNSEIAMLHDLMLRMMMLWIGTRDPDLETKVMDARLQQKTEYSYDRVLRLFAINALSDKPIIS